MVTATEAKAKTKKPDPLHPPTKTMVQKAIAALGEKKGSSAPAIKKYVAKNFAVPPESKFLNNSINKFLRNAVERGEIILTKGQGANGRYKLPDKKKKRKAKKAGDKKKATSKKMEAKKQKLKKKSKPGPASKK